jgi:peptidoglycan hydrolase-like protein with peptidoglycan-binding domain
MSNYIVIDRCPVPERLAPCIQLVKNKSGQTLVSCYRGDDARELLRRNGKMSQQQLWDGWEARKPGFNPANRPGKSTHELRNDGVAYRGRAGRKLFWWQCGMDWTNSRGVVQAFKAAGFQAAITYPTNPREQHHVNLRKEPKIDIYKMRPLKRGSKGARVRHVTRMLCVIKDPTNGEPYLLEPSNTMTTRIVKAVKAFQRDHHQKADGIVGSQTRNQLGASYRFHSRKKN